MAAATRALAETTSHAAALAPRPLGRAAEQPDKMTHNALAGRDAAKAKAPADEPCSRPPAGSPLAAPGGAAQHGLKEGHATTLGVAAATN